MLHSNRSPQDNRRSAQRSEGSFGQGLYGIQQLTTSVDSNNSGIRPSFSEDFTSATAPIKSSELSLTYYKILQLHANVKKIFLPLSEPVTDIKSSNNEGWILADDFISATAPIKSSNLHGCKGFWEKIQEIEENNTSVIFHIYFLISRLCLFEKKNKRQIQKWVEYKYKTAYNSIITNIFLSDEIKEEITVIFQKTQRTYFALKRFLHIYTSKKTTTKINTDLCLNPIDPSQKNKIEIIQNNAKYLFTTADILNLTMVGLINSQDFFAEPRLPKNPYTNIPFTKTDMYNIYFHIVNTRFITPPLLTEFFLNHFELDNFLINNETKLRNISIKDYVLNSPSTELYSEVKYMIRKYFNDVQKIEYKTQSSKNKKKKRVYHTTKVHVVIDPEFPKEKLVEIMRPYLYLYILSTDHIYGTEKRLIAKTLFKYQVKKFMKYNYKFGRKQLKIPTKNYLIPSRILGNAVQRIEVFEESTNEATAPIFNFVGQMSTWADTSSGSLTEGHNQPTLRSDEGMFHFASRTQDHNLEQNSQRTEGNKVNAKMVSYFNDSHEHLTIHQVDEMFSTKILLLNKDDIQSEEESVYTEEDRDDVFDYNYEDQLLSERQRPLEVFTQTLPGAPHPSELVFGFQMNPDQNIQENEVIDNVLVSNVELQSSDESLIYDFANILTSIENSSNYHENIEIRNTELLMLPYNSDNESTGYDSN